MNLAASVASFSPHRWIRSVPWIGALLIVAIVAMAGWDIVHGHRVSAEDTDRELETQARVIAEQTARSVQAIDVVLRHVAAEYRRGRLARLSPEELHTYLRELSVGLKQIDGFGIYDANGNAIAQSWQSSDAPMRNIAELPGFQALRADPKAQFGIDNVFRADDGVWAVPMGRRLETPSGDFAGLVGARGVVDYFQQFYRDIRFDPGTKVTLLRRNGTLLARYPPVESALGKKYPAPDEMIAARESGQCRADTRDEPDRQRRAFRRVPRVPDYPLAVVVTRDADVALAAWRAQARGTAMRTLALGLLGALLLAIVTRQIRRLDATRASLEASRERFALAVAGSDDGIWDWDQATGLVFKSLRARELFGLGPGPDTLPVQAWEAEMRLHPDDAPRRLEAMKAHMAGRTPLYEGEYRVRHGEGSYRWIRIRGLCIRDPDGQPLRMAGSVSDIDARKRAEEALRLSEERYALAMAGLSGGHWVWDIENGSTFMSESLHELFDIPAPMDATTTQAYCAAEMNVHRDDRAGFERVTHELKSGIASRADLEYRIVLRDGSLRWITTRAQAFTDASGKVVRVAGVSVDTTARKRTEEALRASEERFALAVAGSDDGVWDWDFVANLAFESARARELQGLPPGPELQPLPDLIESLRVHPDDRPRRAEGIRAHLAGETPAYEVEYRVRHGDDAEATRAAPKLPRPPRGAGRRKATLGVRATAGSACARCASATPTASRRAWPARSATSTRASAPRKRCASRRSATRSR